MIWENKERCWSRIKKVEDEGKVEEDEEDEEEEEEEDD